MPGASAPPRNSPSRRHDVEVGRGAEVDHDARPAEEVVRGERVDDPVGADLLRVVGEHRHPGPHSRLDDDRRHVGVVAAEHRAQLAQHGRHGRAHRDAGDVAARSASRPRNISTISSAVVRASVLIRQMRDVRRRRTGRGRCWCCRRRWRAASDVSAGRGRCRGPARSGSARRPQGSRPRSRRTAWALARVSPPLASSRPGRRRARRPPASVDVHVVEQHQVRAGLHRLRQLGRASSTSTSTGRPGNCARTARNAARHPAGGDHVVVLDQRRVRQPHPVVDPAAAAHRVLLQRPQPGRRLAGVPDRGPGALDRVDPARG